MCYDHETRNPVLLGESDWRMKFINFLLEGGLGTIYGKWQSSFCTVDSGTVIATQTLKFMVTE